MTYGSNDLRAPDIAWVLRGRLAKRHRPPPLSQARPLRHPACPRPGSRRTPHLESTCALSLPSCAPAIRGFATPLRISASLCRRTAKPSRAFALTRGVSRRHAIAEHCLGSQVLSVAYAAMLCFSLALSRGATPSRDIAFQSRRPANLGGALPSPCHASLYLRQALLLKATPSLPVSVHRRCMPRLCFAVASRCFAPQCRGRSWLLMAELPNAAAYRSVAGPSRGRSFPCYSFAALLQAALVLRRAWPSRAFPSRRRAKQISSFAALGLAGLLRRRSARCHAILFRRLPEQIKALPLQRHSSRFHRVARQSHANPLPPTSSRCRRISLKASLRCSVAPPRYAAQIHRRTMPLMALPSRIIATLR